jgi:hypothetical protein
MNKQTMIFFSAATLLFCSVEGQAIVEHRPIQRSQVDLNEFHARHPEAIPREGVTGRNVGCIYGPNRCATESFLTK